MQQEEEQTLVLVNSQIRKERLNLCYSCEFIRNLICSKCKCLIRAKTLFKGQTCPEGKWSSA